MKRSHLTLILSLLALVFAYFGLFWGGHFPWSPSKPQLLQIEELTGTVDFLEEASPKQEPITKKLKIYSPGSFVSAGESETNLLFRNGTQIKLLENSELKVSIVSQSNIVLTLILGHIDIISEGDNEAGSKLNVQISEYGSRYSVKDYIQLLRDRKEEELTQVIEISSSDNQLIAEFNTLQNSPSSSSKGDNHDNQSDLPPPPPPSNIDFDSQDKNNKLTNVKASKEKITELKQVLATKILSKRVFFYRCYTGLLQRDKKSFGKLSIQFTVEPRGKVSHANIVTTVFKDKAFHDCLLDVVLRTDFAPFEGSSISTLFPLNFQKTSR